MSTRHDKRTARLLKTYGEAAAPETAQSNDNIPAEPPFFQQLRELETWRSLEVSRNWEISSLETSVKVDRVPRGLRLLTMPNYAHSDPAMLPAWIKLQHQHCIDNLNFLVGFAKRDEQRFQLVADNIQAQLTAEHDGSILLEAITAMEARLDALEERISDRKRRKFVRDKNDYTQNTVFTFAKRFDGMRKKLAEKFNKNSTNQSIDTQQPSTSAADPLQSPFVSDDDSSIISDTGSDNSVFPNELQLLQFDMQERSNKEQSNKQSGKGGKGEKGQDGGRKNQQNPSKQQNQGKHNTRSKSKKQQQQQK